MGLYDSVFIDRPDLGINPVTEWQTKDLPDMWCRRLDITVAGRLILHDVEYEATPKAERPFPEAPDGSLDAMCGSMRAKTTILRDLNYHGILTLINCDTHEYWRAKFTDGVMVSLEVAR